jgi:DNA-binding PadR family transcriptional regulator
MLSCFHCQIYPELAKLEAQGMVTHHVVEQHDSRPDKKVYEITEAGREALRHSLGYRAHSGHHTAG